MKKASQNPDEPTSSSPVSTQKPKEVSEQSREQQLRLAGMLILGADELAQQAREVKRKREQEVVELHSGFKITIGEINAIVSGRHSDYLPMFPNNISFFSEIARLSEVKFDPTEYIKPAFVGKIVVEVVYGRFDKPVLPALRALNPAYTNRVVVLYCQ